MVKITEVPLFPEQPPDSTIRQVELALIETNEVGPQTKPQLISQIKAFGVLEPIKVIPIPAQRPEYGQGKRYEVIDGRRRLDAAWKAGLASIPCVVIEVGRDEAYSSLIALSSHALRSENHAWELSKIQEMLARGASQLDIARHSGMTIGQIKERMRLLALIPALREAFDSSRLTFGQAKRISSFPESLQQELAETLAEHGRLTGDDIKEVTLARRSEAAEAVAFELGDLDDDLALRPEDLAEAERLPITVTRAVENEAAMAEALTEAKAAVDQLCDGIEQAIDLIANRQGKQARAILAELLEAYRSEAAADVAARE